MIKYLINEHTFDIEPLRQPGATVLDVGCLDFALTKSMLMLGCRVCGVEPVPLNDVPEDPNFKFCQKALVSSLTSKKGKAKFHIPADRYGAYVETDSNPVKTPPVNTHEVELIDIATLTEQVGWGPWTAVKLDCEGSEYEILRDWPGPISRQISVEFHDHLHSFDLTEIYDSILNHLGQWYTPVKFNRTGKHHMRKDLGGNYWDTLFVLHEFAK